MKETGNIHGCICEKFGTAYYILEQPNGHAAHCYVTGNCWDGNDAIITARVKGLTDHCCDFVRTDLNTGGGGNNLCRQMAGVLCPRREFISVLEK